MDILIMRLVHILAGVIWAGTAITFARYVEPTVNEIGPSGQSFMQALVRRGYSRFITLVALTGIISGLYLYWRVSGGLDVSWITSGRGLTLTLGALSALVALALGPIFYGPATKRLNEIGQAIGATGPTPEQQAELAGITHRLSRVGIWSALLLGFTVLTMAGAGYIEAVLP